ncbi:MAG: AI-2E family transporter [Candidatus Omnitrophica bacterium]|nr:AI-2E family transporter [Candidatus Omnitrophota bacterium]MDD5670125.1 AI-2E family transporter [Candidatus Omnitrophota bacterium]
MTRDQLISFFFIALLVFVIYQIFEIFAPFTRAIFWAAILAFGFYPFYEKLRQKLKTHDILAAFLMTVVICLIVIPPLVILIVNITGQAIDLYQSATDYVKTGQLQTLIDNVRSVSFIRKIEEGLFQWDIVKQSTETWILNTTRTLGNFTATQVGMLTKNLFFVFLNMLFMLVLVFIFLKDGHKIYLFIQNMAPLEAHTKKAVFSQISETFTAVIRGQLLTSLVQALFAGTFFWLLGLPIPILLALATFLTSLIPVIGASGVWVPLVIYLVLMHAYTKAVILFVLGVSVISVIDNLLKPAIIGEKTKLPYFLLLFGILGGIQVYGIMGIFLAPVVLSLFFALVKIYQEKYLSLRA